MSSSSMHCHRRFHQPWTAEAGEAVAGDDAQLARQTVVSTDLPTHPAQF